MPNPEPTTSAAPSQNEATAETTPQLYDLRVRIARIVGHYFLPLLIVTILFALLLVMIIATPAVTRDTAEKMALAASVQVAFGMIIGYVCVYIGLMMTWFGIEASYDVKAGVGTGGSKGELSLTSASPGLLFALGGIILIAVCLYKPIVYESQVPVRKVPLEPPAQSTSIDAHPGSGEPIVPNRPPPLDGPDNGASPD